MTQKVHLHLPAGEIRDRADFLQKLGNAFSKEPPITLELYGNERGKLRIIRWIIGKVNAVINNFGRLKMLRKILKHRRSHSPQTWKNRFLRRHNGFVLFKF